jgi:hypothetical protein
VSQVVGTNFKTRIPTLSDDASIEEALRVYHYGVDNYSVQEIPQDSIEGHFSSISSRVTALEETATALPNTFLSRTSTSSFPNIVIAQTTTTVPITVRAIASQTSALQQWQNSSNTNTALITTGGSLSLASYLSVGSISTSSNISASINILNPIHKGVVVKSAVSQSANLQEWQNSSGSAMAWISSNGSFTANLIDCGSP